MTEAEWLECTDPRPMLQYLKGKAGERKFRLFACACVRRVWNQLTKSSRRAVELAERDADGDLGQVEWRAGLQAAHRARMAKTATPATQAAHTLLNRGVWRPGSLVSDREESFYPPARALDVLVDVRATEEGRWEWNHYLGCPHPESARLLRDIFGNPFRPVAAQPLWLAWNSGTIPKLARTVYDERAFDRLPILADALEDAGCTDADILSHCRGPGPHVRGCWVLDLLLGKE